MRSLHILCTLALGLASPAVLGATPSDDAFVLDDPRTRAKVEADNAAAETATCTLNIHGIPPAVAHSYNLTYDGRDEPLGSLQHDISFAGDRVTVNLTGPRYYGYRTIPRDACLAGAVDFPVRRKAAVLDFRGAPPNTTVECISGAPCPDLQPRLIGEAAVFPELPMERDQATIVLRFKSSGYSPRVLRLAIQPGANQIDVPLETNCCCRDSAVAVDGAIARPHTGTFQLVCAFHS